MKKSPDFSYPNSKGKIVRGAPAFNHFVYTDCGGVDEYNKLIIQETLEELSELLGESIAAKIETRVRRNNIKKIG